MTASGAVVTVGDGRGFVIEARGERFIVTAAHCLPALPSPASFASESDRTYPELVGGLGTNPRLWVECVFADPVADIAVLAAPDGQLFPQRITDAFEGFIKTCTAFIVADLPRGAVVPAQTHAVVGSGRPMPSTHVETDGWMFSLGGEWIPCQVESYSRDLWTRGERSVPGMSGSPILDGQKRAVGVVTTGGGTDTDGPHPRLADSFPGWLVRRAL